MLVILLQGWGGVRRKYRVRERKKFS